MEGGRSAWLKHVMSVKKEHPNMSLGDAMQAAKKTWKGGGGTLMNKAGPMGGRRSRKQKKVGGTLYGFTGGPYTGSELPDGMGKFPVLSDATYQNPSSELLRGGRRRHSKKGSRRHRKVGGAGGDELAPISLNGHPADLPYSSPSVAPSVQHTDGPVGMAAESSNSTPAPTGGRKRKHTKKAGKRRHH